MATHRWQSIENLPALEALFERSHQETVLLFLHAPHCPIGLNAFYAMQRLDEAAAVIDVRYQRTLTQAIEDRTGVQHESPQVLVLRHGSAVWNASHFDITADTVARALAQARNRDQAAA
jgi:bacillithiol system protein YtxJ